MAERLKCEIELAELVWLEQAAGTLAPHGGDRKIKARGSGLDSQRYYEDAGLNKQRVAEAMTLHSRYTPAEIDGGALLPAVIMLSRPRAHGADGIEHQVMQMQHLAPARAWG